VRPSISERAFHNLDALLDAPMPRVAREQRPVAFGQAVAIHPAALYNARRAKVSRILVGIGFGMAFAWVCLCWYVGFMR
jgi:hypothetical protein